MTAQRIMTRDASKEMYTAIREVFTTLETHVPLRRLVWTCEICGMVHSGVAPEACDSCGATDAIALQQDIRPEVNSRW